MQISRYARFQTVKILTHFLLRGITTFPLAPRRKFFINFYPSEYWFKLRNNFLDQYFYSSPSLSWSSDKLFLPSESLLHPILGPLNVFQLPCLGLAEFGHGVIRICFIFGHQFLIETGTGSGLVAIVILSAGVNIYEVKKTFQLFPAQNADNSPSFSAKYSTLPRRTVPVLSRWRRCSFCPRPHLSQLCWQIL